MISVQGLQVFERLVDHIVLGTKASLPSADDAFDGSTGLTILNSYIDNGMPDQETIFKQLDSWVPHYKPGFFSFHFDDPRTMYIKYLIDNFTYTSARSEYFSHMRYLLLEYCSAIHLKRPYRF